MPTGVEENDANCSKDQSIRYLHKEKKDHTSGYWLISDKQMLRSIGTYHDNCEIHGHTVRGSNIRINPAKIYVNIVLLFN